MPIKIDRIQIQKLGPLNSVQLDLGMLNLIYGHNESGKTYMTEFLLHSVFRHAKTWDLREVNPEGSVHIQGLGEQTTIFSPSSPKKIEDYWGETDKGLPLNMARLLIVKGGELALTDNNRGGVDREVLKNILTSQALLDQIKNEIQPTVRKAHIIDQKVSGNNQGQIHDLNVLQDKLEDIEKLLGRIDEKYSRGPARQIEHQIDLVQLEFEQILKAKGHKAYLLFTKLNDLQERRNKISDERYLSLRDRVRDHKKLKSNLKNISKKIKSSQNDVATFQWLKSATEIWEENELENKRLPEKILLTFGGVLLAAGLIFTILHNIFSWPYQFWAGIILSAIGGLLLAYFSIQLLIGTRNSADASERVSIQTTFKEKFGHPLKGITSLRAEQNKLQEVILLTKSNQEERSKLESQITSEQEIIIDSFHELIGETISEKDWDSRLKSIKDRSAALDAEISSLALTLAKLNLEKDHYLKEPQAIKYDQQVQTEIEERLANLNNEISVHHSDLDTLKARAAEWTRDDISTPWVEILHHLRVLRISIRQSLIDLTAEIVAKIGLSEILTRIEEEEDQKIIDNINTTEVSDLLNKMTGKYQSLNLIADQLYTRDSYHEYPLKDLSTGAREQVQLALRLGIASRVNGGEPLFIVLDDAFQHSDWERREILVKVTVDLAKKGWQIIYLTMDDHIRDLFLKQGKAALNKKFAFFEI